MLFAKYITRSYLGHLAIILLALSFTTAAIFMFGEIAYRVARFGKHQGSFFAPAKDLVSGALILHERRGWAANPQYSFIGKRQSASGAWYDVIVTFHGDGYRSYGEVGSHKKKVLVIGDSMTHAIEVGDGRTFYDILGRELEWEIFAYGVGGYGTLQQYLFLEEILQNLSFDLVLWQFSTNDFINNDFELESKSLINANNMRRPFLVEGEVVKLGPKPRYSLPLFFELKDISIFINVLQTRYQRLMFSVFEQRSIEHEIVLLGSGHEGFDRSQRVTRTILEKSLETLQGTPVVAFLAGAREEEVFSEAFNRILADLEINYLGNVSVELDSEDSERNRFYYTDRAHWNEEGHARVAAIIKDKIRP